MDDGKEKCIKCDGTGSFRCKIPGMSIGVQISTCRYCRGTGIVDWIDNLKPTKKSFGRGTGGTGPK